MPSIDWRAVEREVQRLRQRIFKAAREPNPHALAACLSRVPRRVARTVLRGDRRGNSPVLPGRAINLTGVWKTVKAAIPSMIEQGNGGSVLLTSSGAGLVAYPNLGHYVAAKHGVVGLMRALAVELAPHGIRCNSVNPGTVDTPIIAHPGGI
jgi:hypothetical protein